MTDRTKPYLPLSTKEGWERFVTEDPPSPVKISHAAREAQSEREREQYDIARRQFMTGGIVRTPAFNKILFSASSRLRMNEFKHTGKLGLIVSGEPALGKTTTVTQIGKIHNLRRQHQEHPVGQPGCIPAVYVTVPPACGPKAMIAEFAEFFGLPSNGRISHSTLLNTVSQVMARVRTELVIVDEIHNLNVNYRMSADASDALKQLSEKCKATFIYAGVNVESCGLLDGARGQQISSRFELHRVAPFSNRSKTNRAEWEAVLLDIEDMLCLTKQREGDILIHSAKLFADSGGSIGRLVDTLHLASPMALSAERAFRGTLTSRGISLETGELRLAIHLIRAWESPKPEARDTSDALTMSDFPLAVTLAITLTDPEFVELLLNPRWSPSQHATLLSTTVAEVLGHPDRSDSQAVWQTVNHCSDAVSAAYGMVGTQRRNRSCTMERAFFSAAHTHRACLLKHLDAKLLPKLTNPVHGRRAPSAKRLASLQQA